MAEEFDSDRLCGLLEKLSALLTTCGEEHWASWMQTSRSLIADRREEGLDHFLGAFGGMGSFNDLHLHPRNDHTLGEDGVDAINVRLKDLQSEAYRQANGLKRGLDED